MSLNRFFNNVLSVARARIVFDATRVQQMFCNNRGLAIATTASSCAKCGHPVLPLTGPPQGSSNPTSDLPYGWGRFYAGLQIAGGLFLLAFLLLFWSHLYPHVRRFMLIAVAVVLPLGYGLWNRARWNLYLLTIVAVLEVCTVIAQINHGGAQPVPADTARNHGVLLLEARARFSIVLVVEAFISKSGPHNNKHFW